jgi:hypothetical protein
VAEEEIRLALAALRQLAHGLVPPSLIDEDALRELGASSDVPTTNSAPPHRVPSPSACCSRICAA